MQGPLVAAVPGIGADLAIGEVTGMGGASGANLHPPEERSVSKIIKDMEARGEIPPLENFPAGQIRVIVVSIVNPPKRDEQQYC
jgi:hypothetical protein